eukprot:TRINITY_DN15300_c0_g1_i1.p1 TRINITY_DN15300_c0_g1~~TRINITY_DN15300_c0_g1_i1.p1  ORF type:complete len:416 (-),score=133.48 TRINITY_DN15300_c0_g1_i1:279-1526(-)
MIRLRSSIIFHNQKRGKINLLNGNHSFHRSFTLNSNESLLKSIEDTSINSQMIENRMKGRGKVILLNGFETRKMQEMSLRLAKKLDGELISGDILSSTIGCKVASERPLMENLDSNSVNLHLFDQFSFKSFPTHETHLRIVSDKIDEVVKKGKTAIVIGKMGENAREKMNEDASFYNEKMEDALKGYEKEVKVLEEAIDLKSDERWLQLMRSVDPDFKASTIRHSKEFAKNLLFKMLTGTAFIKKYDFRPIYVDVPLKIQLKYSDLACERQLKEGLLEELCIGVKNGHFTSRPWLDFLRQPITEPSFSYYLSEFKQKSRKRRFDEANYFISNKSWISLLNGTENQVVDLCLQSFESFQKQSSIIRKTKSNKVSNLDYNPKDHPLLSELDSLEKRIELLEDLTKRLYSLASKTPRK